MYGKAEVRIVSSAIIRVNQELAILGKAWQQFQQTIGGLSITQPELLGKNINILTNEIEGFERLTLGTAGKAADTPGEYMLVTMNRAIVLRAIIDHMIDSMQ